MTNISPITRTRARALRRDMTPQERRLWPKLRELNHNIATHFRRQAPVGPYIADFADLGRRLVIEVDGGGHGSAQGQVKDQVRDRWFASQGFTLLRFWNTDVDGNIDVVMQVVLDAVEVSLAPGGPPPPAPPHEGEGRFAAPDGAKDVQGGKA